MSEFRRRFFVNGQASKAEREHGFYWREAVNLLDFVRYQKKLANIPTLRKTFTTQDGAKLTAISSMGLEEVWIDVPFAPPIIVNPENQYLTQELEVETLVIVGYDTETGYGFRWTEVTGKQQVSLPGYTGAFAYGVSSDGNIVVGFAFGGPDGNYVPFRWTQSGGGEAVDFGTPYGQATAISGDGLTISGATYTDSLAIQLASLYSNRRGPVVLGSTDIIPESGIRRYTSSVAKVSYNGRVAVGYENDVLLGSIADTAVVWDEDRGRTEIKALRSEIGPDATRCGALGVSDNGQIVIGTSFVPPSRAFTWTRELGVSFVGMLPGGTFSRGGAISGNGLFVAGVADGGSVGAGFNTGFFYSDPSEVVEMPGVTDPCAISDSGLVVGNNSALMGPVTWTRSGGMKNLGFKGAPYDAAFPKIQVPL